MITNLSLKSGTYDSSYLGSAVRILTKYRFTAGGFSGGFTLEKDSGEKLLTGNPPLPDFISAHISYNGRGFIRRIIIGDYSARFGQGTNINTGIRRGISLISPGYMSASDEIRPYSSTEENRFLRGFAAQFSVRNIEMSIFISKHSSDATIAASPVSSEEYIVSFLQDGVHNTPSLLKKKDAAAQLAYGAALSYNLKNLKIGLVWSQNRFSLPVNQTSKTPEKVSEFTGDKNSTFTAYYSSFIRKILLYGEFSANSNKKLALIQGVSFRPSDRLTINFLFRDYNSGYTTFIGSGPGSSAKTANEKGVLGNFTFEAAKHLFISGGYDIHNFHWLKYRCSSPSWGTRHELKVRYLPSDKLTIDASFIKRLVVADNTAARGIPDQLKIVTRSYKITSRYSASHNLSIGARIDYNIVNPSESQGFMISQELNYNFRKVPVTLWARYCLFNTDSWASRIYSYENDLLYSFSIPALAGEGSRSYIMARWKIGKFAEIRIKYGITSTVTNGNSCLNTEEIKAQFRVWF